MKSFQYSLGDRPLDGYTIKRGIGRGGFGEVYFAISDGGKEVALKIVRANLEVELRGMRQCLNLKHPNLVDLYDLRSDRDGNYWVVMEYVTGDSMHSILRRHQNGVAPELAREWFFGLADAIQFLHEQGIVHRDLKPGNIFLEHGVIKVGDYGLCKFIGGSQHDKQTESVGTVHYMAPEISSGNYNRQIDIYAAGIILYEMLTGHVPFSGESPAEILMKHMTSSPNLREVPSEYVHILERALCKNPAHRYRTIGDMAKEVRTVGEPKPAPHPVQHVPAVPKYEPRVVGEEITQSKTHPRQKSAAEICGSMALATIFAGLLAVLWTAFSRPASYLAVANSFFLTVSCCWGVIGASWLMTKRVDDSWKRRVAFLGLGLAIGLEAIWLQGYQLPSMDDSKAHAQTKPNMAAIEKNSSPAPQDESRLPLFAAYLSFFGLIFFVMRWWKMAERHRPHRFSLYPVLAAGFWAYVLYGIFANVLETPPVHQQEQFAGFVALIMASIIIQLVSPWEKREPLRTKRVRLRYA